MDNQLSNGWFLTASFTQNGRFTSTLPFVCFSPPIPDYPPSTRDHQTPSPAVRNGLIRWRCLCQLSSVCLMKELFTFVPGSLGRFLATWDTCESPLSTGIIAMCCSCLACSLNITCGMTFSVWWFVQDSAIILPCPNSLLILCVQGRS